VLQRGIAITGWFAFRQRRSGGTAVLSERSAIADSARRLRLRPLPVQPEFLRGAPERLALLIGVVRRLQHAGLGVVIDAHPATWHLESSEADRAALLAFWRSVAPALRGLDPG